LVMAGGLLGAVIGPNLATYTRNMLDVPFAGAYAALAVVALVALVIISFIRFPATPVQQAKRDEGRSLREIARQPTFVVAALTGALSYGVMNLLMAATPLAMQVCGLSFENTALVLQWHVIGMFAPGFFTGHLIKRFGTLQIMAVGAVLNFVCILIALSGIELHQFLWSSFLLGVGWNFLFTGSTTLSLSTCRKRQGPGGLELLHFWHHGGDVVCLRGPGHHTRLDLAQRGFVCPGDHHVAGHAVAVAGAALNAGLIRASAR
jgi:cyanate permease